MGLTKDEQMVLPPPPGLEHPFAEIQRGICKDSAPAYIPGLESSLVTILAETNAQLRQSHGQQGNQQRNIALDDSTTQPQASGYPLKPPGVLIHPRTFSSASTVSGEDSDGMSEMQSRTHSPEPSRPMCEHKVADAQFPHELQDEPLNMTDKSPLRVHWPVDAKKLRGRDQQVVSPSFDQIFPGCSFKLMLKPKVMG